jgi:chaperone required for assembly of F1-ATPase
VRDILNDLEDGRIPDPQRSAQQTMRASLPKRFYKEAAATPGQGGFSLTLDGRPARTPARAVLAVPTQVLGAALAAEWNRQVEVIDPALMPLTRLVNTAIDGVTASMDAVADEIARYAGSDLACYRAAEPAGLVARQQAAWDPVLDFARLDLGALFVQSTGVLYVEQPARALQAVRVALPADPFRLAALHVVTTLTGSVLLAVALDRGVFDAAAVWDKAHVDEDWNQDLWGADTLAGQRKAARLIEFEAAATVLASLKPESL